MHTRVHTRVCAASRRAKPAAHAGGGNEQGCDEHPPQPPPPPPRPGLGPGRRRPWEGAAASRPPHDARRVRGTHDDAPGNAVTNRKHLADLLELDLAAIVHDLGLDDGRKLRRGRRILLGRCARAGGTREAKSAALLHDRPNFARGRFGGGAQSGEGGAQIRGTSGASPVPLRANAVARGADLAALCAPTAGVERRPRTATAAARRDAPGVLRTTREMVDIEIPAQTQERAVRVGLSEARKGPDDLGSAFAHSECRCDRGAAFHGKTAPVSN